MMLFAVLGVTLAVMQSGDFEVNLRNLDSERALYLAESGGQWALNQLSQDGGFRTDATHGYGSGYAQHSLSPGQYNVSCSDGTGTEAGKVIIVSTGYVPTQANPRGVRMVRMVVVLSGSLSNVIGCQVFDWSAAKAAHTVTIDGDIGALNYNGDGNSTYNEVGTDYRPTAPLLPAGSGARAIGDRSSTIPMQWYHDNSDCEWPNPGTTPITSTVSSVGGAGGNQLTATSSIFTSSMVGQAVRNLSIPTLPSGAWADCGWAVITTRTSDTRVTVDKNLVSCNNWQAGNNIRLVRRYSDTAPVPPAPESGRNEDGGPGSGINYIGATITHDMGYVVDTVIDLRSDAWSVEDVKIVCEGDIFIKGPEALAMKHSRSGGSGGHRHPPLATQNGNIICLDATRQNDRIISGVIFSETGTVNWNYLKPQTEGDWLRGGMIYGRNIILDGDITIKWLTALVPPDVAKFGASEGSFSWQEQ
jgi:hypothetical protein